MLAMLDEKEILLSYIEGEKYEAAQAATQKTAKESAAQLLKSGKLSIEEVTQYFPSLSAEDVEELKEEAR
ncbi:MAG: hypothetical protein J1F02_11670 [Lachnospiraceae bacterium]|nr:hypothetical protein [Lachnospiraceae bacterium]